MLYARFLYDILFILSFVYTPWFVSAVIGLIGVVLFKNFFEIVFGALYIDLLFGTATLRFFSFHFVLTLGASFALVASSVIRRSLRLR